MKLRVTFVQPWRRGRVVRDDASNRIRERDEPVTVVGLARPRPPPLAPVIDARTTSVVADRTIRRNTGPVVVVIVGGRLIASFAGKSSKSPGRLRNVVDTGRRRIEAERIRAKSMRDVGAPAIGERWMPARWQFLHRVVGVRAVRQTVLDVGAHVHISRAQT